MDKYILSGNIKKNSTIELNFVDLTYEGLDVAKHDGLAIFVKNT